MNNNFGNTIPEDIESELKNKDKNKKKTCCICF